MRAWKLQGIEHSVSVGSQPLVKCARFAESTLAKNSSAFQVESIMLKVLPYPVHQSKLCKCIRPGTIAFAPQPPTPNGAVSTWQVAAFKRLMPPPERPESRREHPTDQHSSLHHASLTIDSYSAAGELFPCVILPSSFSRCVADTAARLTLRGGWGRSFGSASDEPVALMLGCLRARRVRFLPCTSAGLLDKGLVAVAGAGGGAGTEPVSLLSCWVGGSVVLRMVSK